MIQTGVKRKADSEPGFAVSAAPMSVLGGEPSQPPNKTARLRTASDVDYRGSDDHEGFPGVSQLHGNAENGRSPGIPAERTPQPYIRSPPNEATSNSKEVGIGSSKQRRIVEASPGPASVLPAGRVFPIQIGCELFRLSGASISSDSPSYFSHYFGEQLQNSSGKAGVIKTLYIDRDPATFRDIVLHLQGYYVRPRDTEHFVRLFADAQFYSLPRLTQQLFKSEIFIQIGDKNFQIPRDIFSGPGDSPNFFSLGFAHFFTTPSEVFPGLDQTTLLRPPSILPPSVQNRSGEVFQDLIRLLQGYPVHVRDESHRADLLRDARYFHLKGLEQRLLPHVISFNLLRNTSEIVIRLEDIRQSGISFKPDNESAATSSPSKDGQSDNPTPSSVPSPGGASGPNGLGYISYARPFTDDQIHVLILEIGTPESTRLHFLPGPTPSTLSIRATFVNQTLARVSSLFQVIASKLGLPATQPLGLMLLQSGGGVAAQPFSPANSGISDEKVKVFVGKDAYITLDGEELLVAEGMSTGDDPDASPRLLRRHVTSNGIEAREDHIVDAVDVSGGSGDSWVVCKAHWRLRVALNETTRKIEVIMDAVRIEALSAERARNASRKFLS